jgi:lactoylglutathione lyase
MTVNAIRSCDYVILLCENMARTRAFYTEVLGFSLEMDTDHWVSFQLGATLLTLRPRTRHDGPGTAGSAAVQLAFRVPLPAVDTCYEELAAKGVEIVQPPTNLAEWRHRALFFRDPEHNLLEIFAEY